MKSPYNPDFALCRTTEDSCVSGCWMHESPTVMHDRKPTSPSVSHNPLDDMPPIPKVGRFASSMFRDQGDHNTRPLFTNTCGLRFDRILVRLTPEDYRNVQVHSWIMEALFYRLIGRGSVTIEVTL